MIRVEGLFQYPVKSLAGNGVPSMCLEVRGLPYDRRWMVTDDNYRFVTQREIPKMAIMTAEVQDELLNLSVASSDFFLSTTHAGSPVKARVWKDEVHGLDMGPAISEWLTQTLGAWRGSALRLVRISDDHQRIVDPEYVGDSGVHTSFADGYPYLVTSVTTLKHLNEKLRSKGIPDLPMSRFRPNIVVSGLDALAEHKVSELRHPAYTLSLVKPCSRCKITTIDQETAAIPHANEPLHTLIKMNPFSDLRGAYFGENTILASGEGATISVGDQLEVIYS